MEERNETRPWMKPWPEKTESERWLWENRRQLGQIQTALWLIFVLLLFDACGSVIAAMGIANP